MTRTAELAWLVVLVLCIALAIGCFGAAVFLHRNRRSNA